MITENYIKMCEQAEEIQKVWRKPFKNYLGDLFWKGKEYLMIPEACSFVTEIMFEPDDNCIWLPTQEQLQEIIGNQFVSLDGKISRLATIFLISNDQISWNEFWLMYVMHEKYNKFWTGEKWVKADD